MTISFGRPPEDALMPEILLFDDHHCSDLYPFHRIEGAESIRHGAFTQRERWERMQPTLVLSEGVNTLYINSRWIPKKADASALGRLTPSSALVHKGIVLAKTKATDHLEGLDQLEIVTAPDLLMHANDLFTRLEDRLLQDLSLLKESWDLRPSSTELPTHVFGSAEDVWVASSAQVRAATVDTTKGPVVIGPKAVIEAGSHLEGPLLVHEGATVRMGACIKGATVIGPHCKVGGEVSNVHFQGWANKAHDGFLGNSVIGRWCNLGAGTQSSNLKNTYGEVRQWSSSSQCLEPTGLQFCGLLMGDHSRCGIGSTFNTGTVVGPGSVIFDAGFPPKHVPPFSWLNAKTGESQVQDLQKMMATSEKVMARRGLALDNRSKANLSALHAERALGG